MGSDRGRAAMENIVIVDVSGDGLATCGMLNFTKCGHVASVMFEGASDYPLRLHLIVW